MIEPLFNQPSYVGAKKMLDATMLRSQAIAKNIANLETPNYRRVDLSPSFQAELKRALGSGDVRQIATVRPSLMTSTTAVSSSQDGNTVRMERELMELSQNALQHTLQTQLISGRLSRLRLAITGRPV